MTNPEEQHPAARRVDRILSARIDRIRDLAVGASTAMAEATELRVEADKKKALADAQSLKLLELVPRNEAAQMLGIKVGELPKRATRKRSAERVPAGPPDEVGSGSE